MSLSQHRVGGMPRPLSALALGGPGSDGQRGLASTLTSEASDLRSPSWQTPGAEPWGQQLGGAEALPPEFADRQGPFHLLG